MRGESCYDEMRFQYYPMVEFAEWAAVAGARGTVSWCRGLGLVGLLALVLWAPSSPALELVETPQVIGVSMRSLAARGDEAFARQWQAAGLRGETGCRRHCAMIGRAVAAVLAAARGQSDFARGVDWRVAVSASGSAEAYAYPGGQIVVSEGLIDSLSLSEAQLAFVLAHEVAHVLLQHERQTLALADAMILPRGVSRSIDDLYFQMGFDFGILLKLEPLLKRTELEADAAALVLGALAGYRPNDMAGFVRKLAASEGATQALVATHPAGPERLRALEQALPLARGVWRRYGMPQLRAGRAHQHD